MATTEPKPWRRRLAWLAGLWLASVATLSVVAWLLGWLMQAAGLQR